MDDQSFQSRDRQQTPPERPLQPQQHPSQSSMPSSPPPVTPPAPHPENSSVPFTPSPAQRKPGKMKLLLWFLLIATVSAGVAYFFTKNYIVEPEEQPVATGAPTVFLSPTIAQILPEEWYPFEANEYNMAFAYPAQWGTTTVEEISVQGVKRTTVDFSKNTNNPQMDFVTLTKYADYAADVEYQDDIVRIKNIYQQKGLDKKEPLWLPQSNAGLTHFSNLTYIENTNATLRGVIYFARIAQNLDEPNLNTLILVLTDGQENIMQVTHRFSPETNEAKDYTVEVRDCIHEGGAEVDKQIACNVNKGVFENLATYQEIASKAAVVHGGQ